MRPWGDTNPTIVRTILLYLADLDTQKLLAEFDLSFQDDFLETKVPKLEEKTSANLTAVASCVAVMGLDPDTPKDDHDRNMVWFLIT